MRNLWPTMVNSATATPSFSGTGAAKATAGRALASTTRIKKQKAHCRKGFMAHRWYPAVPGLSDCCPTIFDGNEATYFSIGPAASMSWLYGLFLQMVSPLDLDPRGERNGYPEEAGEFLGRVGRRMGTRVAFVAQVFNVLDAQYQGLIA